MKKTTERWDHIIDICSDIFRKRGKKAEWSKYVGLPKQRVSDFFGNKSRIPNAEILLATLEWIQLQDD